MSCLAKQDVLDRPFPESEANDQMCHQLMKCACEPSVSQFNFDPIHEEYSLSDYSMLSEVEFSTDDKS